MNFFNITTFNLDLLTVGIAVAAIALIGILVYLNNPTSSTNRAFFFFALVTIFWNLTNFFQYQFLTIETTLYALRFNLFVAVWHALTFFHLAFVFPQEKVTYPKWYRFGILPIVGAVSILTLTPFVFSGISELAPHGEVTNPERGVGIVVFSLVSFGLLLSGLTLLFVRVFSAVGLHKRQMVTILTGMFITAGLILFFNVLLPIFFNALTFLPYTGLFMFPFIALVSYAIFRQKLFDFKVIAVTLLVFVLAALTFVEIIFTNNLYQLLFRAVLLGLVVIVGVLLTRGVVREVEQRERIEKLAKDLEAANERLKELDREKTEFVSIASHQLRAPLTAIKGYASLMLEKSYGEVPQRLVEPIERIAESSRLMVNSIEDFLNVSRIELGRLKFDMTDFNLVDLTKKVVAELTPLAKSKNLELRFDDTGLTCLVNADIGKIKQVITNLTDNAIKYTEQGSVVVTVTCKEGAKKAKIAIRDTGIGLSQETIGGLFEKFIRARDANKVNTTGTGLGLYVAKQLVEGQNGRVWVESEGEGKGSQFYVELPLK